MSLYDDIDDWWYMRVCIVNILLLAIIDSSLSCFQVPLP
jgi:hypothetical protein